MAGLRRVLVDIQAETTTPGEEDMRKIHWMLLPIARQPKLHRKPGASHPIDTREQVCRGTTWSVAAALIVCLPVVLLGGCGGSEGQNPDIATEEVETQAGAEREPAPALAAKKPALAPPAKDEPELFTAEQLEMLSTRYARGGGNPVASAVRDGYLNRVRQLLDAGFGADRESLSIASSQGNAEIVRMLLAAGGSPADSMYAAVNAGHDEVVGLLLDAGGPANLTIRDRRTDTSVTPLQIAAQNGHSDIARRLLEAGAPVDMMASLQETALHAAAQNGHADVVRVLLEWDADVNAQFMQTALHAAAQRGDEEVARLLLRAGAPPDALTRYGDETPLFFAAANGNEKVVGLLLKTGASAQYPDRYRSNPLHAAVRARDADIVRQLLEAGAEVNHTDHKELLPIQYAASRGTAAITKLLLEAGAPADMSAFLTATELGHADVAGLLMEAGASVLSKDYYGDTMLHFAAREGHPDVVALFIEAGAPVDVRNNNGRTPILLAVGGGNQAVARINEGDPSQAAARDRYMEVVRLLIKAGGPLDWRYGNIEDTLLHYAARAGAPSFVKVLLEGGEEPNVRNARGETPLHYAAGSAYNTTGVEAVRLLLDAGASVDAKDNRGRTALDSAKQNLEAWRLIKSREGG